MTHDATSLMRLVAEKFLAQKLALSHDETCYERLCLHTGVHVYNNSCHAFKHSTDEANDIVALQVCVFYLIYFNNSRWLPFPDTPSPGTVHKKTQ